MTSAIHDAVLGEFRSYYLADELPRFLGEHAAVMARASAGRLRLQLDAGEVRSTVELLRAMRDDPTHPVVRALEHATLIEWTDDPEQWAELRELLGHIAAALERGS